MTNIVKNTAWHLKRIIERDVPVTWTHRQVIKHVISRLARGYETYASLPRNQRREFLTICIKAHNENRDLYFDVMQGRIK